MHYDECRSCSIFSCCFQPIISERYRSEISQFKLGSRTKNWNEEKDREDMFEPNHLHLCFGFSQAPSSKGRIRILTCHSVFDLLTRVTWHQRERDPHGHTIFVTQLSDSWSWPATERESFNVSTRSSLPIFESTSLGSFAIAWKASSTLCLVQSPRNNTSPCK